jgi:hypothetical protein
MATQKSRQGRTVRKKLKWLSLLALAAGLTGCAIGWVRPGGTEMELDRDRFECLQQAAQVYPQVMMQRQIGGGYVTPSRTQCYGYEPRVTCTTYPGSFVPPQFAIVDGNEDNRNNAVSACLRDRGYAFHIGFK